jgi:hydrophobe/amphiphile efflux-1 (HAE1) family protein
MSARGFYEFFIDRPISTGLLSLGLLVFGIAAFLLLPVAALPNIEYPTIIVEGFLPGASADTMATTVAAPLERQLGDVTGLISMTSENSRGVTSITMRFEPGRDMATASAELQADIDIATTDLPADLTNVPGWYRDNPADTSVFVVALTSDNLPLTKVDAYGDAAIARRATLIPGVRKSANYARQKPAIRISINPVALSARDLTLEEVRDAIRKATVNQAKGRLDGGRTTAILSTNDQLYDASEFGNIIIATRNDAPVRLSDVAHVENGTEDESDLGSFNGKRAVAFGFKRTEGANIVQTVDNIRQRLPEMQAALPPGVKLEVAIDRSQSIRRAVRDVEFTLLFTTALVVLVIFLFLRRLWATIIPSVAIPISLLTTCMVMFGLGYTIDNLSLMALTISVGFVVDDAIVVIENIARHIEAGASPQQAALKGVREVGFTILSITISLVAVFIPVLFMGGLVGRLFREFGVTLSAAILISAFISLTLTPMMCRHFLTVPRRGPPTRLAWFGTAANERLLAGYRWSLDIVLHHQGLTLLAFLATLVFTVHLYMDIPKSFFPPSDTGRLSGSIEMDPDLAPKTQAEITGRVVHVLQQDKDLARILSYSSGHMIIETAPAEQRTGSLREVVARVRAAVAAQVPEVQFYLTPQPELALTGWVGHAEYQYTMTDSNWTELQQWAPRLADSLKKIPGLLDVDLDEQDMGTELKVEIDREMAARLGVGVSAVDETLYDAFGERKIREIYTDSGESYVILQVDPQFRTDEKSIQALYVRSESGALVPLSAISSAKPGKTPLTIKHKDQLPAISVSFNLAANISLGEAVERIRAAEQAMGKPVALQTAFEGAAGEFERSLASEPWLIGAAVLVVYIVLGVMYESILHPLTILSTLPSAGIGALLLLRATGYDLSIIAIIGILLLIGIVKKNAIMMLDFAITAQRQGATPIDAIRGACLVRFRPIMMTTMAALVGSLPLAMGSGTGFELRRPLGIAIVGGLLLSQIITLYTTPVIFLALDRLGRFAPRMLAWRHVRSPVISPNLSLIRRAEND